MNINKNEQRSTNIRNINKYQQISATKTTNTNKYQQKPTHTNKYPERSTNANKFQQISKTKICKIPSMNIPTRTNKTSKDQHI